MSYTSILVDVSDGIGTVTLNLPEKRNPLGEPVTSEVVHALNALAAAAACRVVVITGAGKAFCAGANLRGLQQTKALEAGRQGSASLADCSLAGFYVSTAVSLGSRAAPSAWRG